MGLSLPSHHLGHSMSTGFPFSNRIKKRLGDMEMQLPLFSSWILIAQEQPKNDCIAYVNSVIDGVE